MTFSVFMYATTKQNDRFSLLVFYSKFFHGIECLYFQDDIGRPGQSQPSASLSLQDLPPHSKQQSISQHPVMNQYTNQYYQPQKESFYDVPSKYRYIIRLVVLLVI